jgi:hypothetical protein
MATESGGHVSSTVKEQAAGVGGTARQEAGAVAERTAEAAGEVAGTAREQVQQVAGEAMRQARDVVGEARTQARDQASAQRDKAVSTLHSFAEELRSMVDSGGQSGLASELAGQLADRTERLAGYLEGHEPGALLDEVREFARRRPGAFLAGAAVAGVLVGRLTRGVKDQASAESGQRRAGTLGTQAGTPIAGVTTEDYTGRVAPAAYAPGSATVEPLVTEDPRRIPGV